MTKILSTNELLTANRKAAQAGKRSLDPKVLVDLDSDGVHVVTRHMLTDDTPFVRAGLFLKLRNSNSPLQATLDIPIEQFNRLRKAVA